MELEAAKVKMAPQVKRCIGCQWRTPHRFGGRGIHCFQKNGHCPKWVVKLGLNYHHLKPNYTDDQLLETVRL